MCVRTYIDPELALGMALLGVERIHGGGDGGAVEGHVHERGHSASSRSPRGGRKPFPRRAARIVDVHMAVHHPCRPSFRSQFFSAPSPARARHGACGNGSGVLKGSACDGTGSSALLAREGRSTGSPGMTTRPSKLWKTASSGTVPRPSSTFTITPSLQAHRKKKLRTRMKMKMIC